MKRSYSSFDTAAPNNTLQVYSAYLGRVQFSKTNLCSQERPQSSSALPPLCRCGSRPNQNEFISCCGNTASSSFTVRVVDFDDYMDCLQLRNMEEFQISTSKPTVQQSEIIFDSKGLLPSAKVNLAENKIAYLLSLLSHAMLVLEHLRNILGAGPISDTSSLWKSDLESLLQLTSMLRCFFDSRPSLKPGSLRAALVEKSASRSVQLWCGASLALDVGETTSDKETGENGTEEAETFLRSVLAFLEDTPSYAPGDEVAFVDLCARLDDVEAVADLLLQKPPDLRGALRLLAQDGSTGNDFLVHPACAQEVYDEACSYNAAVDALFCTLEFLEFAEGAYGVESLAGRSHVLCVVGVPDLDNAFYSPSGVMVFGEGHKHFTTLVSADVVAHELGHGICRDTCNLQYRGESGALNESFSDVMASAFEFHLYQKFVPLLGKEFKGVADWEIGEDMARDYGRRRLRHMRHPHLGMQPQPDQYEGEFWSDPRNLQMDHGGVHINSGVCNRLFYLLATTLFENFVTLASAFVFEVYTQGLSAGSDFADYVHLLCANLEGFLLRTRVVLAEDADQGEPTSDTLLATYTKCLHACLAECGLDRLLDRRQKPPSQQQHQNQMPQRQRMPVPRQGRPRRRGGGGGGRRRSGGGAQRPGQRPGQQQFPRRFPQQLPRGKSGQQRQRSPPPPPPPAPRQGGPKTNAPRRGHPSLPRPPVVVTQPRRRPRYLF